MTRRRIEEERTVVEQMIRLYCRKYEGHKELCPNCRTLLDYAHGRLDRCHYGENKPTCRKCPIHCYQPEMKERIRKVMRWSGPRLILYHPLAAIRHLQREIKLNKITVFTMKNFILPFALVTMLAACDSPEKSRHQDGSGQHHQVMTLNIDHFKWTRQPESYIIKGDTIEVVTQPGTDLWQRTYYHFRNDNAPVFQMETEEKFFSFVVKTDFTASHHRFDQCGIVMYLDSENWLKGSVEYENEEFQHLGSVVTNNGYSDWATTAIPADVKTMWYRLSRREDDYCIECSQDGEHFTQMRVCHMHQGAGKIRFGIYACSPEESSFKAIFTDMKLTECTWKAHDGQQPD